MHAYVTLLLIKGATDSCHQRRPCRLDVVSGHTLDPGQSPSIMSLGGLTGSKQLAAHTGHSMGSAAISEASPILLACSACCPITQQPWVAA